MKKDDYMKLSKARLAELLAERDARDALLRGMLPSVPVSPNIQAPACFFGGPCTNPQMDCINCPRKGGGVWVTNSNLNKEEK